MDALDWHRHCRHGWHALVGSVIVLVATLGVAQAWAQDFTGLHQPYFQRVDANKQQLAGPVVSLTQDSEGFLWLLSGSDLWRWDGYWLRRVDTIEGGGDPVLQCVTVDAAGAVWVGAAAGLFRLTNDAQGVPRLDAVPLPSLAEPVSIQFLQFRPQPDGRDVLAANAAELVLWRGGSGSDSAVRVPVPGNVGNRIHALQVDGRGRVWAGTTEGLYWLDESAAPAWRLESRLPPLRVGALHADAQGRLWVGTPRDGLFLLEEGAARAQAIALPLHRDAPMWVYSMAEVRPGTLWLGMFGAGVLEYDHATGRFRHLVQDRTRNGALGGDNVWALLRDRAGLMWAGTEEGLDVANPDAGGLLHLPLPAGSAGAGTVVKVYSVLTRPDGGVWLGTNRDGIKQLSPTGQWSQLVPGQRLGDETLPAEPIATMRTLSDGSVLVGSDWWTARLTPDGKRATALRPAGRGSYTFTATVAELAGSLWLGGPDGLWQVPTVRTAGVLDLQQDQARNRMADAEGDRRVVAVLPDGDTLWIGTWLGLKRLDVRTAGPPVPVSVPGLDAQFVTGLLRDAHGRLWVGTGSGGVFVANVADSANPAAWTRIGQNKGLPDNYVNGLTLDADGHVWVGSSRGIARVNALDLSVVAMGASEGASAAPYVRGAIATLANGSVAIGGTDAVTLVQPAQWWQQRQNALAQRRATPMPLVVTDLRATGGMPSWTQLDDAGPGRGVQIPAGTQRWAVEFAALDFLQASNRRYRYRLQGWDDAWTTVDAAHRVASYTALPPGRYSLQLRSALSGEGWPDAGLDVSVEVLPLWHQTAWFRFCAVLSGLAGVFGLYRGSVRMYRRREAELEARVRARTAELAEANRQLREQTDAVEVASLTDPLTGLGNRRFLTQRIEGDVRLLLRRHHERAREGAAALDNADLIFFLVDLDHFKLINDRHGHAAGDAVLVGVRGRLQQVFRDTDYLVRWGGEEFLVVARDGSREAAPVLAERLREAVNAAPFDLGNGNALAVTCSMGYAAFPFLRRRPEALGWDETVRIADAALYAAKRAGRNGWCGVEETAADLSEEDLVRLRGWPESALEIDALHVRLSQPQEKRPGVTGA